MPLTVKISTSQIKALQKKLESLKEPIDKKTAESVGYQVILMMKKLISKGISPIKGAGRFPKYKDPDKYPGRGDKARVKGKRVTPVNLELTGKMLDSLGFDTVKSRSGYVTEIGYDGATGAGPESKKEQGHRDGANGQPKRPTLPTRKGEDFAENIRRVIADLFKERIKELTRK